MSDCITTFSRVKLNPLNPKKENILIDDIAHALSLMARANGHFPEFYSVAQHSIFCCEEAIARGYSNRVALACLLHDASEAYMADIIRPVKKHLSEYLEIEEKLQTFIYRNFIGEDLSHEELKLVSFVDNALLYNEFVHYMNEKLNIDKVELLTSPDFKFTDFKEVEHKFKELFYQLVDNI